MLVVKRERKYECSEKVVYLNRSKLPEIVKLYSPQTEGNKDYEAHRWVDFLQYAIWKSSGTDKL